MSALSAISIPQLRQITIPQMGELVHSGIGDVFFIHQLTNSPSHQICTALDPFDQERPHRSHQSEHETERAYDGRPGRQIQFQ